MTPYIFIQGDLQPGDNIKASKKKCSITKELQNWALGDPCGEGMG